MPWTRIRFGRAFLVVLFVISVQAAVLADDFGNIVQNIERHYGARKKKIPLLGLAGFAVKVVHPAGVKSFKLAVFENQNFTRGERDYAFDQAVRSSINSKWKPMIRSNSRSTGNRSYVYAHRSGKDVEMLTVTLSPRQAVVVQAKVDPDAMAKFLEKPELLGFSLAGSLTGSPSMGSPTGGVYTGSTTAGRGSSLDSLRTAGAPEITPDRKSQPALSKRSTDDSEFNPLSGVEIAADSRKASPDVLHIEARLVNLNVKATDRGGVSLSRLRKED
ncbi:MAG TPA: hypothetical protein VFV34_15200, partial [Blastocatellia bacterium]|nr:hypothetical protein [Blastocatellia bacterium]